MKNKATITIGRPSNGDGTKFITIAIRDSVSRIIFADIEIDLADFAEALTGLSEVECSIVYRCLENVGKVKETKKVAIKLPNNLTRNEKTEYLLSLPNIGDGWVIDPYIGSQNSITLNNGDDAKQFPVIANVSYKRYV